MNAIDKLANISGGATLIGEPSCADVMIAIEKADDLDPAEKRHLATSLRQMALYLGRPLTMIPTRIASIGPAIKGLHPARLGVHAKTFANHRSNARRALLWFNRQTPGCGRKALMDSCYRLLWDQVADRYARDMLSPFFRFLSAFGVQPHDVRDSHVEAFIAYRKERSF